MLLLSIMRLLLAVFVCHVKLKAATLNKPYRISKSSQFTHSGSGNGLEANENLENITCANVTNTVDILKNAKASDIILTGRLRNRHQKSGLTSQSTEDEFILNIVVIEVYKKVDTIENEISAGPFYFPTTEYLSFQAGCLNSFYLNAKYIFFLNKYDPISNVYEPFSQSIEYSEEVKRIIYAQQCENCAKPVMQPMPNLQLAHGATLIVSCVTTGIPMPNVLWIRDGKTLNLADKSLSIETLEKSVGHVESILEIKNLISIDSGEYWCSAENPLGVDKQGFTLQVQPAVDNHNQTSQADMTDELIPCRDEHKEFCLNGGQCYIHKSERASFQCRCTHQYFGDRCHFHVDGLLAFAESKEQSLRSLLYELSTTLTIRCLFFTLFGSVSSVVAFYGIWKYQLRSMQRKHIKKRKEIAKKKQTSQMKSNQSSLVNSVTNGNKSCNNECREPFLLSKLSNLNTCPGQNLMNSLHPLSMSPSQFYHITPKDNCQSDYLDETVDDRENAYQYNTPNSLFFGPNHAKLKRNYCNSMKLSTMTPRRMLLPKLPSPLERLPILKERSHLELVTELHPSDEMSENAHPTIIQYNNSNNAQCA